MSAASALATRRGVRIGPIGVVVRRRALVAGLTAVAAIVVLAVVAKTTGAVAVPLDRIVATLAGHGTRIEQLVVIDHRLARLGAGVLVGFALGCSGALTQTITRNPIATPDILGVTAGASAVAVFALTQASWIRAATGLSGQELLVPAATLGGLLTTALILGTAWRGGFDGYRLVLVGIGFNALAVAVTAWLLTRASIDEVAVATRWLTGSLGGAELSDLVLLVPSVAVATGACLVLTGRLAALRLGRETATSLGTGTARTEATALAVAVLTVSVATAVAGPIAFVAFVAPHLAMRWFGTAGPPPLAAGLTGALLLVASDLVAERLPSELPVGVVTTIVGAPALLYFMSRHLRRSSV